MLAKLLLVETVKCWMLNLYGMEQNRKTQLGEERQTSLWTLAGWVRYRMGEGKGEGEKEIAGNDTPPPGLGKDEPQTTTDLSHSPQS
ncbi:hypothetical protein PoB_000997500 [Plakobranchus ocellatus]|uniref:Uncharacterized protein n=1 Tax=Plakobranchus ocellatus TaxID=259542 RepID=A0AAV3YLV2_9GAST|nr:hypothetical protein PoB_000997500 [Plakobranchus ocellatus]